MTSDHGAATLLPEPLEVISEVAARAAEAVQALSRARAPAPAPAPASEISQGHRQGDPSPR
ncbi:MAG: hypothetical protein H6713_19305 [Myxococcales bacterium]|nr:hypothetical protein [Myxococcales bacterium]